MKRTPLRPGAKSYERGSTFANPRSELKRTKGLERTPSKRRRSFTPASDAQREAIALHTCCTHCGRERSDYVALDAAHLVARSKGGCDHELCTPFALCRTFDGSGCHRSFDDGDGSVDLLTVVNAEPDRYREALQHALCHMNVVELVERLAGARTQWSDQ
jgi:hypothetical protein